MRKWAQMFGQSLPFRIIFHFQLCFHIIDYSYRLQAPGFIFMRINIRLFLKKKDGKMKYFIYTL